MPKIIFRPNPTPPPFVPPTPPVQNPSVFFNPYPFEPDTPIHVVLTNLDLPANTNKICLQGYVEAWDDWAMFNNVDIEIGQTTVEFDSAVEASSAQISRYQLTCWHVEGGVWSEPSYVDLELLN